MSTWLCLSLLVGFWLDQAGQGPGQAEPRAILEKALQAHSGDQRTLQLKAVQTKSKGTFFTGQGNVAFTDETQAVHPVQLKSVKQLEMGGKTATQTIVLNGDRGWIVFGDTQRDLEEPMIANLRENLHQDWIARIAPLLADKDVTLASLSQTKIDGKEVTGIKAT